MHLPLLERFSALLKLSLGVGEAPKRLSLPLWMTLLEVDTDLDLLGPFWLAGLIGCHRHHPGCRKSPAATWEHGHRHPCSYLRLVVGLDFWIGVPVVASRLLN